MSNYIKKQIIEQSRHLFIYGRDGENRKELLESLETEYPVKLDSSDPSAIYLKDFGLPKIETDLKLNDRRLSIISREYLDFSIVYNILKRINKDIGTHILRDRIEILLKHINRILTYQKQSNVDYEQLIDLLKTSIEFYLDYYVEYLSKGKTSLDINDLQIPFIDLNSIIPFIKEMLNNNSYFGVIIDNCPDISHISKQAINGLVTSRINGNISMKIATDPEKWETYYDLNGMLTERVHDYGTVELDNSDKEYTKKLKNKYYEINS